MKLFIFESTYTMKISKNNSYFYFCFLIFQIFYGNRDSDTVVYNILKPPITAHFIQILPLEWHNHISLRIEIYGCPGIPKYFQTVLTVTKNLLIKPLVNLPGLHQHSAAAFFSFQHLVWVKSCDILTNRHVILKATISQLLWLCLQLTSKNMTTKQMV